MDNETDIKKDKIKNFFENNTDSKKFLGKKKERKNLNEVTFDIHEILSSENSEVNISSSESKSKSNLIISKRKYDKKRIEHMSEEELKCFKKDVSKMLLPELQDICRFNLIVFSRLLKDQVKKNIFQVINSNLKKFKKETKIENNLTISKFQEEFSSYTNNELRDILSEKYIPYSRLNKKQMVEKLLLFHFNKLQN